MNKNLAREILRHALDQDSLFYALKLGNSMNLSQDEVNQTINEMYKNELFSIYSYDHMNKPMSLEINSLETIDEKSQLNTWLEPNKNTFFAFNSMSK